MNRLALYVLAVLAAAGWAAAAWQSHRADRIALADTVRVLRAKDWTEGRLRDAPKPVAEVPDGADRVAAGEIRVEYVDRIVEVPADPTPGTPRRVDTLRPVLDSTCPATPALLPGDLAANIRFDIVRAGDRPFGIATGTISARLGDQEVTRDIPPVERALSDLWVARDAVDNARRWAYGVRRPRHWRTGWFAGLGAVSGPTGSLHAGAVVGYGVQF